MNYTTPPTKAMFEKDYTTENNEPVDSDETSLENALAQVSLCISDRELLLAEKPKKLLVLA